MGINIKNLAVETRIRELATIRGMNLVAARERERASAKRSSWRNG
jgi:hypothetical protein